MSAAFQLESLSSAELDARAAAAVSSYGVGTKSYNGSAEKREIERQREMVTARYEAGPRQEFLVPLLCRCPQREYPHELSVHRKARFETRTPRSLRRRPRADGSLRPGRNALALVARKNRRGKLSTERKAA